MHLVVTQDFFPQVGGAHLWLYEVYRRWPQPVTVLTRRYEQSADEVAAQAAFDATAHGSLSIVRADMAVDEIDLLKRSSRAQFFRAVRQVRQLRRGSPLTVHCLRAFPEGFVGLLSKLLHPRTTRLVVYAHGEETLVARSSRQVLLMARLVYRFADLVIANSRSTVRMVEGVCRGARIVCVHPGVDALRYALPDSDRAWYRSRWGFPEGTVVVSTVARMEPRKNQRAVIEAIATLRRKGVQVGYVCGGSGEELARLRQFAEEQGVADWVRFPGVLTEDEKVLTCCASDLYAMPSVRSGEMIEGFGIVFLEAAAAGIPAICGDTGGQPEAVLDGETGLVVDGRNVEAVCRAIERLASDPSLRRRMGQKALRHARQHDWSNVAASCVAALSSIQEPAAT